MVIDYRSKLAECYNVDFKSTALFFLGGWGGVGGRNQRMSKIETLKEKGQHI